MFCLYGSYISFFFLAVGWFELYWLLIKKAVCLLYVRYIDLHGCNAYLIDFGWYFTAHYVCVFDEWFFSLAFISFHGRFQYLPPRTENAFILPNLCCNTVSFPVYKMKVSLNFFFTCCTYCQGFCLFDCCLLDSFDFIYPLPILFKVMLNVNSV